MKNDMLSDAEFQKVVQNLLEAAVPERKQELDDLWKDYQLHFKLLPDNRGFVIPSVVYKQIIFNQRAMWLFWLASFIAWEALMEVQMIRTKDVKLGQLIEAVDKFSRLLKEQGPLFVMEMLKKAPSDLGQFDEMLEEFVRLFENKDILFIKKIISNSPTLPGRFDEMFEEFAKLHKEEGISTFKMPKGVPEPCCAQYTDSQKSNIPMAMDLAKLAVAWVFLHEIKRACPVNCVSGHLYT